MIANQHILVSEAIRRDQSLLVEKIMSTHFQLFPDLAQRYDARQTELCKKDIAYNLSFLSQAIEVNSTRIFEEYIIWLRTFLSSVGVRNEDVITNFECMKDLLLEHLDSEAAEPINTFMDVALATLKADHIPAMSFIVPENPSYVKAGKFLELILNGDRSGATRLILDMASGNESIKDIYLNILQPVQREIGLLWQTGKISVAKEHYCTGITQLAIAQLYPYIFNNLKKGKTMVATCVSGELHEVGLRMLSDIFELEGWDTWYLGANMPHQDIVKTIIEKQADLVAISATMTFHLNHVVELINAIRKAGLSTSIMVGGYPFNLDNQLWKKVGANAYAKDAVDALRTAEELLSCG